MSRLSQIFSGKDGEFFDLFERAAANNARAAAMLGEMLAGFPDTAPMAKDIREREHEGDQITHDIIRRLNTTAAAPLDREDVLSLASGLDDVLDLTEEVADFLVLYRIEAPMDPAGQLARILSDACDVIAAAMPRLRGLEDVSEQIVEIHRLENDGDRAVREGIASLFDRGVDPMVVIRWKDIFERLEEAIDATEHVATTIETIFIKNS